MGTRIGLVADTHIPEARKSLWPQVYEAFEGVDYIFHGGDVHDLDLLDTFESIAPVYCARGNGEDGSGGRPIQPEDPRVKYTWALEIENVKIGLTHYAPIDNRTGNQAMQNLIREHWGDGKPDVLVSGDTHTEIITECYGILCVNPGSPTYPHNYDTQYGTIGFLDLDDGKADPSVWLITDDGIEPFDWDAIPPWKLR